MAQLAFFGILGIFLGIFVLNVQSGYLPILNAPSFFPWIGQHDKALHLPKGILIRPRNQVNYTSIMQKLWDLDVNGMDSTSMILDIQGKTNTTSRLDMAPKKLFSYVNETLMEDRITIRKMEALLDNYNPEIGVNEDETLQEREEIDEFLDAVCETDVMKEAHRFVKDQGKPFPTMASFKSNLKDIWFTLYPRSRNYSQPVDSSAFEHVFLGESKRKQKEIGGMHNWIAAYRLEEKNSFDYTGYIDSYLQVQPGRFIFGAKMRAYNNYWKDPFSSFIFGSSPEFDLAVYTICFIMNPNKQCSFKLHNQQVAVQAFRFMKTNHIDTAYPVIKY